jgi:peroxiredoxin
MSSVSPGQRAPDFTLPSTKGQLTLSQFLQGKRVVLAFYVEDATPT